MDRSLLQEEAVPTFRLNRLHRVLGVTGRSAVAAFMEVLPKGPLIGQPVNSDWRDQPTAKEQNLACGVGTRIYRTYIHVRAPPLAQIHAAKSWLGAIHDPPLTDAARLGLRQSDQSLMFAHANNRSSRPRR